MASIAMESVPEEDTIAAIQEAYCISSHRTLEQDAAFGIRQIVDMPMRALSPSTNDTTTAVMCVDYLTAILARLVLRSIPSAYRYEEGKLRLLAVGPSFSHLLDEAFDQIRGSAAGNVAILLRVLGGLKTVASLTTNPSRRALLSEHVQRLAEAAEITLVIPHDLARFKTRLRQVQRAFVTG